MSAQVPWWREAWDNLRVFVTTVREHPSADWPHVRLEATLVARERRRLYHEQREGRLLTYERRWPVANIRPTPTAFTRTA